MKRLSLGVLVVALVWLEPVQAQPSASSRPATPGESPVDQMHEVLARGWISPRHPWYDPQAQSVRPVSEDLLASEEPSWWEHLVEAVANLWRKLQQWLEGFSFSLGWGTWAIEFNLYQLFLVLLALGVVWFVVRVLLRWYLASRQEVGKPLSGKQESTTTVMPEPLDQLPVAVPTGSAGLWKLAQQAAQQGQWNQAIVYLYSYLLLQLDQAGWIRLEKGRTNRYYLRQLRADPEVYSWMREIVWAFEDAFFGHHQLSPQRFQKCWELVPQLRQRIGRSTPWGPASS